MSDGFNVAAYFKRIGYDGPREVTYETLRSLHTLHTQTFPFENINPLLRRPIPLDVEALQRKMVQGRRGGYCFEQNLLFQHALQALGFTVVGLGARVLSGATPDRLPAQTHMLLRITIGEVDYLADTGFGSMTLTEPVRLEPDTVQQTSHERRRIVAVEDGASSGDEFLMEAGIRDEWRPLFRFSLHPRQLSDYEMANFYVANRPGSHFKDGLSAARPTDEGRYGLRNNELAVHDLVGNTERTILTQATELQDALRDLFLIDVPDDPTFQHVLELLAAGETIDDEDVTGNK